MRLDLFASPFREVIGNRHAAPKRLLPFADGSTIPMQPLFNPALAAVTTGIDDLSHERPSPVPFEVIGGEFEDARKCTKMNKAALLPAKKSPFSLSKQFFQVALKELFRYPSDVFFPVCRDVPIIVRPFPSRSPCAPFEHCSQARLWSRLDP